MSANTLHPSKKLSLGGGCYKMPFTLGHTNWPVNVLQSTFSKLTATHTCTKVKMCSLYYGWATFVPHTVTQVVQPQPVAAPKVYAGEFAPNPNDLAASREEAMYV